MVELLLAILLAVVALYLALVKSEKWYRRNQVVQRLHHNVNNSAADEDEAARRSPFAGFSARLTQSSLMRDDFAEMYKALRYTGRPTEQIQLIYLLSCWLLPVVLVIVGALWYGLFGALAGFAIGFVGSRRYIRSVASRACYQQNLEAIELAHVLRMMLEAGLSIERGFRIAALQARPLIPTLVYRLDRFNRLMDSGADRGAALDDIGEGKEIPVLHNLTRLLKQAGSLGGSITASIDQIIQEALEVERGQIKERVNKLGAKMTVVMMVLMMPALFIIIGGPAGINIIDALTR